MCSTNFSKLLDAVDDDNVIVGIAYLNVLIIGKRLECNLFLFHFMSYLAYKGTYFIPAFTIRQGVVVAVYPGATSEEIEQQVARPLERYLFTYEEVRREKTTTTSQNGMCIAMVYLNDDVNNKDEVWSKIKHGLNAFKMQLPSGVLGIVVNDDFGNTSALLIAIESPERSYRELKQYSDDLSDRLRRIPSVANVKLFGEQKEQISLYVDRQRLQAYGIGQQVLFAALQSQGLTTMNGGISDNDQQVPIHVETTEHSEEEIANQIIFSDPASGKLVRVRDVARVVREYDKNTSYIEQDGHPCMLLSLEMTPGHNIVQYGKEVDEVLDAFRTNELPDDVTITRIALNDFPTTITISLMVSFLLAVAVIPFLEVLIIKPGKVKTDGNAITHWVQNSYNKVLDVTFRHPWMTIMAGIGIILLSLVIVPTLKIRQFPYADRDQFAVEIFMPEGKGIAETRMIADSLRRVLQQDEDVECITSFVGCSSPRFMVSYEPQMAGKNFAQFIVNTPSNEATVKVLAKYQPQVERKPYPAS